MHAFPRRSGPSSALSPRGRRAPLAPGAGPARVAGAVALVLLAACGGADELASASDAASASGGVSGVQASAATVPAGGAVTLTVTLADAARSGSGGVTVYLSYPRALLAGPRLVRIPNGSRSGSFTLRANPYVAVATATTISANTQNPDPYAVASRALGISPASPAPSVPRPEVAAVAFAPATVASGAVATGTVTLTGPAPDGGAVVQLANPNDLFGAVAEVPAVVVVPGGQTSASFAVPTHLAAQTTRSDLPISGSFFGGSWRGAWLGVVAP